MPAEPTRPGRRRSTIAASALCGIALLLGGCAEPAGTPLPTVTPPGSTPVAPSPPDAPPAHLVVVVFENKGIEQILGTGAAPVFDALAARGTLYTHLYAITHPSQPNYVALFSGSTQGLSDDSCPHAFHGAANLGRQLLDAGLTFTGYAEALPHSGFTGCRSGRYARKHAPWTDFADLPASVSQPYSAFPGDFAALPTVSFVVPDMCDDMHDCPIGTGDRWLGAHLTGYASWARTHHSLLVVTFDEDDSHGPNLIPTIVVGQDVPAARVDTPADQYTILRTVEACFGLPPIGLAAARAPLARICR